MKKIFFSFAIISSLLLSPLCVNAMNIPEPASTEISEAQAVVIVIVTDDVIIVIVAY
jgi:hypothetical protein